MGGDLSQASTGGILGLAAQFGNYGTAVAGALSSESLGANIAINLSPGNPVDTISVGAQGVGNIAINVFGEASQRPSSLSVQAAGYFSTAVNIGGKASLVNAGNNGTNPGILNLAFNLFGSENDVEARPGPVAIAGAIGDRTQPVTQNGPGITINGIRIGSASAPARKATKPAPAATASTTATDGNTRAASTRPARRSR